MGVDNLVAAVEFVLSAAATLNETYIVADPGAPPRLADVIAILRQAQGRRPMVFPLSKPFLEMPMRLLRPDLWQRLSGNLRADPAKLLAAGWQPLHDTRDGLTALIQEAETVAGRSH